MIVTKDSLKEMLNHENPYYVQAVIGRALISIFNRQTEDEKTDNKTNHENGIGFSGADARSGCLTAKYWAKHGRLEEWMIEKWKKPSRGGYPRLCKYHKQLNQIATEKRA